MADPNKGRGRGLRIFEAMKKANSLPESQDTTPVPTPAPSMIGSAMSTSTAAPSTGGGRGKMLAMLRQNQGPAFAPASDVGPSVTAPVAAAAAAPRGAGRGIKLLQQLQASKAQTNIGQGDVQNLTQKMAGSTISSHVPESSMGSGTTATTATIAKNKPFREIKDTPPVVMKGERGQKVDVTSNFVYLKFEENCVFEYEVVFEPSLDHLRLRFHLLGMHKQHFREKTFDGTTLYVPHMLPPEALNLVSVNPHDNTEVRINIIFRRTRRLSEMVHIYNVLFKQIMKDLELIRYGRQHYSKHMAIQIPQHNLEVWPGYVTAVDEYEGGLMLTLDSTHRVLRTQNVHSIMKQLIESERGRWKQALQELLVGTSVMTTYNNKLFRVDTIDENITPQSTFQRNEKGQLVDISYIDYYKKAYGIEIMDWGQPMLICRETKKVSGSEQPIEFMICLVPELCQLTGLSEDQRSNFTLMKDVATYTRITPNQRHAAFKKFIENVMNNERAKARLAGWGLSLAPETIRIVGRTLPAENLYFGNNRKVDGKPNAEWNNEVTRNPVMQAVDLNRWVIMHTSRDGRVAREFLQTIRQCAGPTGIRVNQPDLIELPNDRNDTYVTKLKQIITSQIQMVVCICPTSRDDRYATIKKICCAENPVPSQVINSRTLLNPKKVRAITQKILLQMNCKLGGTLWELAIPCKTAMVVGMDSYHDAGRKKSSVYTFIASFDRTMTRWYSQAVFQEKSQEIVDSIKSGVVNACNFYLKTNGMLPERIIMYRDGVGDGQLKAIRDYEIPQMKISFDLVKENYKPSLTYIIVQKRINTRIFLRTSGGFDNPPPGTVVDHDITRRDWYDFLIASQKVNQGTVTPTHYIVIHDDSKLSPDQCQKLTYQLCHLYYNWPGTVRVPAPCQYAHKLAYLVGQNIHQQPSEQLADKLFFL